MKQSIISLRNLTYIDRIIHANVEIHSEGNLTQELIHNIALSELDISNKTRQKELLSCLTYKS